MTLQERIGAFARLGNLIRELPASDLDLLAENACQRNSWFTPANVKLALSGIARHLTITELEQWISPYTLSTAAHTIGVVMAGNIPLVGFHDFLCVMVSGSRLKGKLSSQDVILMTYLADRLVELEPRFADQIHWADRLDGVDAIIATGSDNTARYFDYYFRSIPRIVRRNRSSCAILTGNETKEELAALGVDVFSYFGLGCRNISQLYVPGSFDFSILQGAWKEFRKVTDHSKYVNNYDYQKAILLVNKVPFVDTGFILIKQDVSLVSPVAVLHFCYYAGTNDLQQKLLAQIDKVQCMVSAKGWLPGSVAFGEAQSPGLGEYADRVDTMRFISAIASSTS